MTPQPQPQPDTLSKWLDARTDARTRPHATALAMVDKFQMPYTLAIDTVINHLTQPYTLSK
jgi:hypothetical protein